MLHDGMTLILDVRNKTITLIEREDDTGSWDIFFDLFLIQCHINLGG
jgi:DNA-binding XRE family transcriptional regulator